MSAYRPSPTMTHTMDGASIGVLLASIAGWLPAVASALTIIWIAIRIWETHTVQGWFGRKVRRRRRDDFSDDQDD